MPAYNTTANLFDAVISVHTAKCGNVVNPKSGWVRGEAFEAADADAARAHVDAQLVADGMRAGYTLRVCPCCREAR